jgi:hypothetical protein
MNSMLIYEVMELEGKKGRRNCKPFIGKQKSINDIMIDTHLCTYISQVTFVFNCSNYCSLQVYHSNGGEWAADVDPKDMH